MYTKFWWWLWCTETIITMRYLIRYCVIVLFYKEKLYKTKRQCPQETNYKWAFLWRQQLYTLKAMIFDGHWRGASKKTSGFPKKDVLLQEVNVETGNVWMMCEVQHETKWGPWRIKFSFCSNHNKLLCVFWLQRDVSNTVSISLGDHPSIPQCGSLYNSKTWPQSTRLQFFSWGGKKKKKKTAHRLVVHQQQCKNEISYLEETE